MGYVPKCDFNFILEKKNFSYELIIGIKKKRKILPDCTSSVCLANDRPLPVAWVFNPHILHALLPFSQSFLCFQESTYQELSISQKPVSTFPIFFFLLYWRYVYESIRR